MEVDHWQELLLGEVLTFQRGFDLPHSKRQPGDIPVVSSSGISGTHSEARVTSPGIVTGRYGTVGEVFFINQDFWPLNTTLFVKNFKGNDPLFISFLLRTVDFQPFSGKSGVPGVNRNDLHSIKVKLPPLPEQKAIALSLSDADAAIAELDRLITKKRNIKQGTMQQLLTGKKRLPGFSDEWGMKRVGDICDFIVPGRNKPRKFEGDIPWITTPDLTDGRGVSKSRLGLCISRDEAKNVGSKIVPAGSVIMSCAGELGIVALAQNEIVINQQLHAFIPPPTIDSVFLLNAIKAQKKYIDGVATKTAVPYLNKDNCNSIPILILSLPEQKAIAQVLTDMDTEIEALEQKRDKYKAIKQGMMQELLTGRTRLI